MRDGPGEEAVLGLFTDWRDLDLHVPSSQTLLAVAEEVSAMFHPEMLNRSIFFQPWCSVRFVCTRQIV